MPQDAPRRDAWQAKADAKERVWRQEQGPDDCGGARRGPAASLKPARNPAAKPQAPARPQAVPLHAQLSTAGSGNKLEAASGCGQDAAQGSGQGSGQGTAQGSGREAADQGSGQGSGQGVEGSGQGSPKLDSKSARSSDTGSAACAPNLRPAVAAEAQAKPSQHAQSLLHEAAPAVASAQASPKPAVVAPDVAHAPAASALQFQLRGYAGPLGGGLPQAPQGMPGAALGMGALPIAPLGAYPPGGFGGFGAAPFFNPYCMVGGAGAAPMGAPLGGPLGGGAPALLGFDPLASWYAHHYARPGGAAGSPGTGPKPCQGPAQPHAQPSGGQQESVSAPGAVAAAPGVTGRSGAAGAPPARWWQDPAAVFGAEVLAGTLAPQAAAPSCGAGAGLGRRTEATSRPGCGCAVLGFQGFFGFRVFSPCSRVPLFVAAISERLCRVVAWRFIPSQDVLVGLLPALAYALPCMRCALTGSPVACREADEAPPAFLPPLKQRSKRARCSASGTDCDEVGQSGGRASGAPSPFSQKPYSRVLGPYDRVGASCGASDVLVSFAGSGGSAFRVRAWGDVAFPLLSMHLHCLLSWAGACSITYGIISCCLVNLVSSRIFNGRHSTYLP